MLELHDIAALTRAKLEYRCQRAAQPVYLGDHKALCRVLGRYKFFVDTRDHGFAGHVLLDGFWEIWLTQFMARTVKPGMHVADIGANFGYYSVLLGDLIGLEGFLHSVEPNPAAAAMLRLSLAQNGFADRSKVHELALGRSEGEVVLCVPAGEPKNAFVLPQGSESDRGPMHRVPLHAFDKLLEDTPRLDFAKIDVEGSEEAILSGMEGLIRKFHPGIVLEFNSARYQAPVGFLKNLQELYGSVRQIDYSGHAVTLDPAAILASSEDWLLYLSQD